VEPLLVGGRLPRRILHVTGWQTYGSSSPDFTATCAAPFGVTVTGTVTYATVNSDPVIGSAAHGFCLDTVNGRFNESSGGVRKASLD